VQDGTIIAVAVPSITARFHSVQDIGWYGSIYNMMRCAFVLAFGKLYSLYSPKPVLLTATVLFEVGSAICGAAPNSVALIVGRGIAGVGAAGIFTGAIVAVKFMFPLQKRPVVMGLLGVVFTVSTVLGPIIGGALTDSLSWRWCFYINLPIGGMGLLLLVFMLHLPSPMKTTNGPTVWQHVRRFDPLGFLTFVPATICLLMALEWGGTQYSWSDWRLILLLTLFGVLLVCAISIQVRMQEAATVPPRIIKQRSIACGGFFAIATGGAVTVIAYYLPLWFQAIKGTSATEAGVNMLPIAIAAMLGSLCSGVFTSRVGYYVPFMISGPILMAVGAGLLTTWDESTGLGPRIAYQVIFGLGSGGPGQQASLAAQTVLNDQDTPIGAAVMMFGTMLGAAVFTSVGQSVFATRLQEELQAVPNIDKAAVARLGATELRAHLSAESLGPVIAAYNSAMGRVFFLSLGLACAALLAASGMEWKSVKKPKAVSAGKGTEGVNDKGTKRFKY